VEKPEPEEPRPNMKEESTAKKNLQNRIIQSNIIKDGPPNLSFLLDYVSEA